MWMGWFRHRRCFHVCQLRIHLIITILCIMVSSRLLIIILSLFAILQHCLIYQYVGAWNNDVIEGFGRYHYNTGRAFEGNFRAGKREGRGKFQLLNGTVEIYRYVDDKRVGDGVRWSKDRKKTWRLDSKGRKKEKVALEEAMRIADRCGPVVDYSAMPSAAAVSAYATVGGTGMT
mmetsp:Transcript_16930/g.33794  ORF Transcript_16930/g.33794 Transcript_16930/m.33794 type:complete len:175 (+) Transcript_16930:22-546(+)